MTAQAKPALRAIRALFALLFGASAMLTDLSFAQDRKNQPTMTLRTIMQELGAQYLRLTNALLIDDFRGLEQSANAIRDHPLPDEIAATIKAKLGKKFRDFERVDEQGHQAAADLSASGSERHLRIGKGVRPSRGKLR